MVKPSVLPLGGGGGKTSSDLKDKTSLQKQQKNQSCATGSGSQFRNKEKKIQVYLGFLFSSPKIPKVGAGKPRSGGFTHSGNSSGAGPGLQTSGELRAHALEVEEKRPRMGSGGNSGPCCPTLPREATPEELSDTTARAWGPQPAQKKPTNKPKITRKSTSVQSSVLCPCLRLGCHLAPAQGHSGTHRGTLRDTLGSSICK